MKKVPALSIAFALCGSLFLSIAFFAELIRLDKNPGDWSRARIAVFIAGLILIFAAILYSQIEGYLMAAKSTLSNWFYSNPIAVYFSKNKIIKSLLEYTINLTIIIIVLLCYTWIATSGTWENWTSGTSYYADIAVSFRNGDLHLPIQPDPKLLTLENPYDASQRAGIDLAADLSFYNGKIYMYWGPVPALILTILQPYINQQISDLTIAFFFVCGIFLVQSSILLTTWKWYFSSLPIWVMRISMLLAGLTGPLFLLRHNYESARVYQATIAGAQFFLIFGIWVILASFTKSRPALWELFIAGLFWALAAGTRLALIMPIGILIFLITIWLINNNIDLKKTLIQLICLCAPLVAGILCLGWYNWARFGSVTESGMYYQLGDLSYRANYSELFSAKYVIQNIYNILFHPPDFTTRFPFVFMTKGIETSYFSFYTVPDFYNAQPITGLIYIFPFLIFIFLLDFQMLFRTIKNGLSRNLLNLKQTFFNWFVLNLIGSFAISFCLLLGYFWAGIRFIGDFMPTLTVISIYGFWHGFYKLQASKLFIKKTYSFLAIFLAALSISISILLVISTNSGLVNMIINNNPFLK